MAALGLLACATAGEDLGRAETHYDDARYEASQRWLEVIEPELPRMEVAERARYYYLRGMTAYRLGERTEARHYLILARVILRGSGVSLRPRWHEVLDHALEDLLPGGIPDS